MTDGGGREGPLATVVVAPEVAARIVARQRAGECLPTIAGALHLTLAEVRWVVRGRHATVTSRPGTPGPTGPHRPLSWLVRGGGGSGGES